MNEKRTTVYLQKKLKEALVKISKEKNISQNAIIRLALSEYIERNK